MRLPSLVWGKWRSKSVSSDGCVRLFSSWNFFIITELLNLVCRSSLGILSYHQKGFYGSWTPLNVEVDFRGNLWVKGHPPTTNAISLQLMKILKVFLTTRKILLKTIFDLLIVSWNLNFVELPVVFPTTFWWFIIFSEKVRFHSQLVCRFFR